MVAPISSAFRIVLRGLWKPKVGAFVQRFPETRSLFCSVPKEPRELVKNVGFRVPTAPSLNSNCANLYALEALSKDPMD